MEPQMWDWTQTSVPPQAPPPAPNPAHSKLATATACLCDALGDEIKASERGRSRRVALRNGLRVGVSSGLFHLYVFAGVSSRVRPGALVRLQVQRRALTVLVHARDRDDTLTLAVPEDLGPSIAEADLEVGAVWLLRALQTRLRHLPPGFNTSSALAAVGEAPVPPLRPDLALTEVLPGIDLEFDEDKLYALRVALRAPLGFVWGPPGTGKTTVLAALVEAHLALGRRVLMLGPTNAAVDEAAVRVARRLDRAGGLRAGSVLRYGDMDPRHRNACQSLVELGSLPPEAVRACQVLATTAHLSYLMPMELIREFDVVIVDEAGAMALPMAFWAAGLAREITTFIGDFRQLGPVVESGTARVRRWLARDVFAASGVTAAVGREDDPPHLAALETQYRMAPPISGLVSSLFYQGRLRAALEVRARPHLACGLAEGAALALVDTSGVATNEVTGPERRRTNPVHVRLVERMLHHMQDEIPDRQPGAEVSVAVLAPYRAQVDLHAGTWGKRYRRKAVAAATVHTFQGGEVDTVILDLTDAPPIGLSPFFRAGDGAEACARLLNVALSRARHRVFVIADVQWLLRSASSPPVRALLAALKESAIRIRVKELG